MFALLCGGGGQRQRSQTVENGDGRNGLESQSGLRTVGACANLAV